MSKSNQKRSKQLGMPHGTASAKLRKSIMFSLIQVCGMDKCYQCGEKIEDIGDLSVEHKIPWLDSDEPVELFFDLGNIAFSHLSCNSAASRGNHNRAKCGTVAAYTYHACRCDECKEAQRKAMQVWRKKKNAEVC